MNKTISNTTTPISLTPTLVLPTIQLGGNGILSGQTFNLTGSGLYNASSIAGSTFNIQPSSDNAVIGVAGIEMNNNTFNIHTNGQSISVAIAGGFSSMSNNAINVVQSSAGSRQTKGNQQASYILIASQAPASSANAAAQGAAATNQNTNANLQYSYLQGANLGGANLESTNLELANLAGAYLKGAVRANLTGAIGVRSRFAQFASIGKSSLSSNPNNVASNFASQHNIMTKHNIAIN